MGYISRMDINLWIKKDKIDQFRQAVKSAELFASEEHNPLASMLLGIHVDDSGKLDYIAKSGKWRYCLDLAEFLKPYVKRGVVAFPR